MELVADSAQGSSETQKAAVCYPTAASLEIAPFGYADGGPPRRVWVKRQCCGRRSRRPVRDIGRVGFRIVRDVHIGPSRKMSTR